MAEPKSDFLDDMFATARAHAPVPSDDLVARVLADAVSVQPKAPVPWVKPRNSIWRAIGASLGGWPVFGGMVAAGVAGLWIGIAPPVALESYAAKLLGATQTIDLWGEDALLEVEGLTDG